MTPITTIYFVSDCLKKNVANKFENDKGIELANIMK